MKRKITTLALIILAVTSLVGCDDDNVLDQINDSNTPPSMLEDYNLNDYATELQPVVDVADTSTPDATEVPTQEEHLESAETPEATAVPDQSTEVTTAAQATETVEVVPNSQATTPNEVPDFSTSEVVPPTIAVLDPSEVYEQAWDNYMYGDKDIMALYFYDIENYTMAEINTAIPLENYTMTDEILQVKEIAENLANYTSTTPDKYGYFIIGYDYNAKTSHKDYVFIDNSNQVLLDGASFLKSSYLYPSWITHMSQENIESATIIDTFGMNITITNEAPLNSLSEHLKSYLKVTDTTGVYDGNFLSIPASNGTECKKVTLNFSNGVYYDIQLYTNKLEIYTSDLNKTVHYSLDSAFATKLHSILSTYN